MLTENQIVSHLCDYLKNLGYDIVRQCTTTERGMDIEAEIDGIKLLIEAKGETSSKLNTARYGKPFTSNQIKSHISRAILTALIIKDKDDSNVQIGIALPNNLGHRAIIDKISKSLKSLEIKIFLVSSEGVIEI